MSYCRWSSDDFGCDLYVYEASDGFCIHVAASRVVGDVPKIDWSSPETLYESYNTQMKFMGTAKRKSIGLPHDGDNFYGLDQMRAVETLIHLKNTGYKFPYGIICDIERGE